jgi:hypothetical protein
MCTKSDVDWNISSLIDYWLITNTPLILSLFGGFWTISQNLSDKFFLFFAWTCILVLYIFGIKALLIESFLHGSIINQSIKISAKMSIFAINTQYLKNPLMNIFLIWHVVRYTLVQCMFQTWCWLKLSFSDWLLINYQYSPMILSLFEDYWTISPILSDEFLLYLHCRCILVLYIFTRKVMLIESFLHWSIINQLIEKWQNFAYTLISETVHRRAKRTKIWTLWAM